jgi:nucleotidyltransferase-like protein
MPARNHAAALTTVVDSLRACPAVIAIGAYGSTADQAWTPSSDVDLLVVLNQDPPIESVRLRVGSVPVDINLRTADDSSHGIGGASFVPEATALWDPQHLLGNSNTTATPPDPSSARMLRYLLAHSIDKARQLESTPELARLFAGGEAGFVVRGYYQARGLWFPGPVRGLRDLTSREPELLRLLTAIASGPEPPSAYLTDAAELALAPIGGLWRDNELFVAAWNPNHRSDEGEQWVQQTLDALLEAGDERRKLV